jgi:hypothetical protein
VSMGSKLSFGRLAGGCVGSIRLAQDRDRVTGCCECGDEPSGSGTT